ncbi:bifunctional cytidylyltransferase/SDR family oxidoreductase [Streptosporangium pseudovulgare]|uniref:2-C-methyl-D-erythritol 4-phosphate cytidylyltransferase n=1 Tax=Streptosporangium pseudovulgare TaxID=35765 RepID=A0ABQ2QSZ8_9ACTN|nr:bifunctional cytidylyltransferase/SDR family oxidoreductase [Streptosporangium pseudovulgare]GGP94014.1 pyrophosphorylase [Streptosporangium pseudovulgare]
MAALEPRLRTVAVVLAGGVGQRVGLNTPKQLIKVAGRTIMEHTLSVFDAAPEIDEIVVLMTPGFTADVERLVARNGFRKVSKVLEGGATRPETTWRALQALGTRECDVLLHDAVRPLLEPRIITECVEALKMYSAVDVAIPSSDTIVVAAPGPRGEIVRDVPDRSRLRRGQTPQCFRLSVVREAYERAFADPDFDRQPPTDDCGVVLRYLPDVPIYIVPGSEHNMKVTHPVDVFIADKLFQLAAGAAPHHSAFAHRQALQGRTVVVFGGSYGIGAEVVELAGRHGAQVFPFSRSLNGVRVEDPQAVGDALDLAAKETGRIDYVVNTAGVLHMGDLGETNDATIAETVGVNYLGPVNIARAALPHLRETRGHLLLYTSSSYTRGRAGYSLYSSTKAAVVNLTQALADEWAEDGVRVNCVNPERTSTPMRVRAFGEEPAHTLLSPRAVAETSLDVLISDITGHVIDVRVDAG